MTTERQIYRHGSTVLSGIKQFKGKHKNRTAIIGCSGTTFAEYDDSWGPNQWARVAVNESIRKMQNADWWVCSDRQILIEYGKLCPKETEILCMHEGTEIVHKRAPQAAAIHTVESMRKPADYDNGFEFFSRGTVLIGAVEMLRYMGFNRFFVFGSDCYRLADQYYYDGRQPIPLSEKSFDRRIREHHGLPTDVRIFITPRLRLMIDKLNVAKTLWDKAGIEIYCVNSPYSRQQAMPLMSREDFLKLIAAEKKARGQRKRATKEEKQAEAAGVAMKEEAVSDGPACVSADEAEGG